MREELLIRHLPWPEPRNCRHSPGERRPGEKEGDHADRGSGRFLPKKAVGRGAGKRQNRDQPKTKIEVRSS